MQRGFASAFALVSTLVVAACGAAQSPAPASTTPAPSAEPAPVASSAAPPPSASAPGAAVATNVPGTGAEKLWDARTHEEQIATMKKVVMPTLGPSFQAFDASRFKDFSCITCHGPSAKQGKFDMPNKALAKLSSKDGFKKHMETQPGMTKFMMQKVVPQMAASIGEKPYDPATRTGFGCAKCHVMEN
jgi:hypothetical protein